jgi:hypothetical protein
MWSFISKLVLQIATIRWIFKLGWLGLLVPIAFLLKTIGLPLLGILSVVAIPLLILLVLFGLPIFAVVLFGGLFMGLVGFVLTIGIAAIKIGLFVVLPIWLVWKLVKTVYGWTFKRGDNGDDSTPPSSTDSTSGGPTTGPVSDTTGGFETA